MDQIPKDSRAEIPHVGAAPKKTTFVSNLLTACQTPFHALAERFSPSAPQQKLDRTVRQVQSHTPVLDRIQYAWKITVFRTCRSLRDVAMLETMQAKLKPETVQDKMRLLNILEKEINVYDSRIKDMSKGAFGLPPGLNIPGSANLGDVGTFAQSISGRLKNHPEYYLLLSPEGFKNLSLEELESAEKILKFAIAKQQKEPPAELLNALDHVIVQKCLKLSPEGIQKLNVYQLQEAAPALKKEIDNTCAKLGIPHKELINHNKELAVVYAVVLTVLNFTKSTDQPTPSVLYNDTIKKKEEPEPQSSAETAEKPSAETAKKPYNIQLGQLLPSATDLGRDGHLSIKHTHVDADGKKTKRTANYVQYLNKRIEENSDFKEERNFIQGGNFLTSEEVINAFGKENENLRTNTLTILHQGALANATGRVTEANEELFLNEDSLKLLVQQTRGFTTRRYVEMDDKNITITLATEFSLYAPLDGNDSPSMASFVTTQTMTCPKSVLNQRPLDSDMNNEFTLQNEIKVKYE